jgi:hypothetical protein
MPTHRFTAAAPLLSWISLSAKPANGCMQRTFIKSPLATKRHGQRQCNGMVTEARFPQLMHISSVSPAHAYLGLWNTREPLGQF